MVQGLRTVDKAMLGSEKDMFEPLHEIKPDIIALGKNQYFDEKDLETQLLSHGIHSKIVRIQSFEPCDMCSSAAIIRRILERNGRA